MTIYVAERQEYLPGWPTPSSIEAVDYAIDRWTDPRSVFWDPMCGRGTAVLRALQLGRDAYGSDLRLPDELPDDRFAIMNVFEVMGAEAWPPRKPDLIFTSPPLLRVGDRPAYPEGRGQWGNHTADEWVQWVAEFVEILELLSMTLADRGHIAVTWRDDYEGDRVLPIRSEATATTSLKVVDQQVIEFAYERTPDGVRPAYPEMLTVFEVPA